MSSTSGSDKNLGENSTPITTTATTTSPTTIHKSADDGFDSVQFIDVATATAINSQILLEQTGQPIAESQKPRWLSSLHSVIFIITCALAVFIVFRNVLTW